MTEYMDRKRAKARRKKKRLEAIQRKHESIENAKQAVLTSLKLSLSENTHNELMTMAMNLRIPDAFRYERDELIDVIIAAKVFPEPTDPSFAESYFYPHHQEQTTELLRDAEDYWSAMSQRYPTFYGRDKVPFKGFPKTPEAVKSMHSWNLCDEAIRGMHFSNTLPVFMRIGNVYALTTFFYFALYRTLANLPSKYYVRTTLGKRKFLGSPLYANMSRYSWTGTVLFSCGYVGNKLTPGSFCVLPLSMRHNMSEIAFRFNRNRNIDKLDPGRMLKRINNTMWYMLPACDQHPFMLEWLLRFATAALKDAERRFDVYLLRDFKLTRKKVRYTYENRQKGIFNPNADPNIVSPEEKEGPLLEEARRIQGDYDLHAPFQRDGVSTSPD